MQFSPVVVRSRAVTWRKSIVFISSLGCLALMLAIVDQDRQQRVSTTATDYLSSVFPKYAPESSDSRTLLPLSSSEPDQGSFRKLKTQKMYIPVRFNPQATEDDVMREMIMRWGKIIEAIEALRRTLACINRCTNISTIPANNVTVAADPGGNETDVNVTIMSACLDTCNADEEVKSFNFSHSVTAVRNFYLEKLASSLAQQVSLNNQLRGLAHTVVTGEMAPTAAASKLQSLFLSHAATVPASMPPPVEAGEWIYVDGSAAYKRSATSGQWKFARIGAVTDSGFSVGDMLWMDSPFRQAGPSDPAPQVFQEHGSTIQTAPRAFPRRFDGHHLWCTVLILQLFDHSTVRYWQGARIWHPACSLRMHILKPEVRLTEFMTPAHRAAARRLLGPLLPRALVRPRHRRRPRATLAGDRRASFVPRGSSRPSATEATLSACGPTGVWAVVPGVPGAGKRLGVPQRPHRMDLRRAGLRRAGGAVVLGGR
jgi:hypothetical protein